MCNCLYIHRIALDIYIYTLKIYNTISHWEGELDGRGHTGRREALCLISFSKVNSREKDISNNSPLLEFSGHTFLNNHFFERKKYILKYPFFCVTQK